MRNNTLQIDENFLKVHPDLAALFKEVQAKEQALEKLKAKKKVIKEELKTIKSELDKRLTVIEAWQGRMNGSKRPVSKKKGNRARQRS